MSIDVYQTPHSDVTFDTLKVRRNWMDETFDKHAYHCFPVSLANTTGWTFSFPEDISFIWRGKDPNSRSEDLEILSGEKYVHANRANGTISFNSGLYFKSNDEISLLLLPVPNQFIDGVQGFSSVISPVVHLAPLPYAWKITRANEIITIPAGTPIVCIMPISLKKLQATEVNLYDYVKDQDFEKNLSEYGKASGEVTQSGQWTNFYRDAVDHLGNSLGEHEVKSLKLSINKYQSDK